MTKQLPLHLYLHAVEARRLSQDAAALARQYAARAEALAALSAS